MSIPPSPWSGIVVSENTNTPPLPPPPNKRVLITHSSERRLLHDSDLTLNSFLAMFLLLFSLFLLRRREVDQRTVR